MIVSNLGFFVFLLVCVIFFGIIVLVYVLSAASYHARGDAGEAFTWEAGFVILLGMLVAQLLVESLGGQVADVTQAIFILLSMVVAYFIITAITRGIARLFPRLALWNP